MLYHTYELQRSWMNSASALASISAGMLSNPANPFGYMGMGPMTAHALDVFAHATAHYGKPDFGIPEVMIDNKAHAVIETIALKRPFGDLLHFTVEGTPADRPRLLIVAPISGHYATLLRGTVERMLESCDVFITDWADAKMVPSGAIGEAAYLHSSPRSPRRGKAYRPGEVDSPRKRPNSDRSGAGCAVQAAFITASIRRERETGCGRKIAWAWAGCRARAPRCCSARS